MLEIGASHLNISLLLTESLKKEINMACIFRQTPKFDPFRASVQFFREEQYSVFFLKVKRRSSTLVRSK